MMEIDEKWIRGHLPEALRNEPISCFENEYLDGLTVMGEAERGGPIVRIYTAENEEDLRYWQFEQVCYALGEADHSKTWRYTLDHIEDGKCFYIEHRIYDYNTIEDKRLPDFERYLYNLSFGLPKDRFLKKVQEYVSMLNFCFETPHWDYDQEKLCFVEISASRRYDLRDKTIEEPRPGSIIRVTD